MPAGYSLLPMYTHHCLLPLSTLIQLYWVYYGKYTDMHVHQMPQVPRPYGKVRGTGGKH